MAETYQIQSITPDVQLVPPNKTMPIKVVTVRAIPSDVVFFFTVVQADFSKSHIELIARDIAAALNRDALVPGVVDIAVTEEINASLQRFPVATVTVESTSGQSDDQITVKYGALFDDRFDKAVAAARAKLDDIESL